MARLSSRGENQDAERQALLPSSNNQHGNGAAVNNKPSGGKNRSDGTTAKLRDFVNTNIDKNRADILLIVSFFISGMVDAGAYNAYECFTSMQTGNTVFAALGVSDLPISAPKLQWTKSLTSIISFLLGSLIITALHRYLGPTKRWVLSLSYLLQACLIAGSAVLVNKGHSSGSPVGGGRLFPAAISGDSDGATAAVFSPDPGFPWLDLVPIALLSFQSAGKVVASRVTGHTGLPVVVLTTLFSDLISDPALFTAGIMGNAQRNRRSGGVVLYFCGAMTGGAAARSGLGFSGGLAVTCAIQVCVAVAWLVWFEEKGEGDEEQ